MNRSHDPARPRIQANSAVRPIDDSLWQIMIQAGAQWTRLRAAEPDAFKAALFVAYGRLKLFKGPPLSGSMIELAGELAPAAVRAGWIGSIAHGLRTVYALDAPLARIVELEAWRFVSAAANQARQQAGGASHYRWRFVVTHSACSHGHRDGRVCCWSHTPRDGHPGQAIGCGCHAEAIASPASTATLAER